MTQLSEFQALKELIHTNLDKYEALLKAEDIPEPFLNEARTHPVLDQSNHVPGKELWVTTQNLAGALDMMASMIQLPSTTLMSEGMATYKAFSLQMATSLNMANVIKDLGGPAGKPVSVDEIGARTGLPPSRVLKVLRPLANNHIFQETSEGYFVNNRASLHLLDECDVKSYVQYSSFIHPRIVPSISNAWMNPESKDDLGPDNAAFLHGFDMQHKANDAFDLFQKSVPDLVPRFAVGMQACNRGAVEGILQDYPWSQLPEGTVCVDIGGGIGAFTAALLKQYPNLNGVVQDRPEVVEEAKASFERNMPDAVASGRVQFEAADFFKEIKSSGPKRVYVMRMIIHDWPDKECLQILGNIKAKMQADSKLIILDTLLQPAIVADEQGKDDDLVEQVGKIPYPLYRSGGVAGTWIQRVDQEVNIALNATERTPSEFKALVEKAGLKLEKIIQPRSRHGIITAVLP
ncbi:Methyltransf_2 domain-containing protein [Pseudozyma hubeiensis]|nr:Methyltransf_2 domain-containing protein [Pseudozyma hubeiensis]